MRVGFIGMGNMAEIMINWSKELPGVSITHLCDVSEARVKAFAKELGAGAHTDYRELLRQEDVDAVYVSAPPALHHDIVMEVFRNGKHVLCEKPLANSVEEARRMAEAAKESGLVNAMHFTLQYGHSIPRMRELIQEGYLGRLRRVEIFLRLPNWPRPSQNVGWVGSRLQGGMALEVCIHLIHAIHTLVGPIVHVQSELEYPAENLELSEEGIIANMELKDGTPILVNALANIAGTEEIYSLAFHGTEGSLIMPNWDQIVGGRKGDPIRELEPSSPVSVLGELSKAIQGQEARLFDFEQGYQAQIVMEALRKRWTLTK